LSPDFAFAIGGQSKPGSMTKQHFVLMAMELQISPQFVTKQARELAQKIPDAIARAAQAVSPLLPSSALVLVERISQ
jgi:serine/threonine-protein kinase HipA